MRPAAGPTPIFRRACARPPPFPAGSATRTPVVEYALDRLFGGITAAALTAAIDGELGSLDALDGFVERAGRPAAWARGAGAVTIVSSDTTIGVAIVAARLRAGSQMRRHRERPDRRAGRGVRRDARRGTSRIARGRDVRAWSGGDEDIESRTLGSAGVVVAFGGSDALRAMRARCAPDATFVPFGHRASAGYVTAARCSATRRRSPPGIARDALLYDGDGCLSLHLLFVERERGGARERFVDALADACAASRDRVSARPARSGPAARTGAYAAAAAFRAANGTGRVLRAPDGAWTIVVDRRRCLPPFGGGVIPVVFVDGLGDAAAYVERHALPLQALGVAGRERRARTRRAARRRARRASERCKIHRSPATTAGGRASPIHPLDGPRMSERFEASSGRSRTALARTQRTGRALRSAAA